MSLYYLICVISFLTCLFLVVRHFILRRLSLPWQLFIKGLQTENSGNLEEATMVYESALVEVKKIKFHRFLQKKITEKLAILHTVITYQKDQHFIRENGSWLRE
jgi:hypothetical protein